MKKRILIAIGGKERKFSESVIFKTMLQLAGGSKARIIVIPTASAVPEDRGAIYTKLFNEFSPASLDVMQIGNRPDASDEDTLKLVSDATLVMFGGGDQLRLSSILGGTPLLALLREKYKSGCVIAGTSAGAAAIPQIMIFQNNRFHLYRKGGLEMTQGLGFIRNVVLDTHFVQRSRISRLIHTVATNPGLLGIGIEENTALVIENEHDARCIGAGTVIIVDGREADFNEISEVDNGKPFAITGIRYSVLTDGLAYDLAQRKVRGVDAARTRRTLLKPAAE